MGLWVRVPSRVSLLLFAKRMELLLRSGLVWDRTTSLLVNSQTLYLLSYETMEVSQTETHAYFTWQFVRWQGLACKPPCLPPGLPRCTWGSMRMHARRSTTQVHRTQTPWQSRADCVSTRSHSNSTEEQLRPALAQSRHCAVQSSEPHRHSKPTHAIPCACARVSTGV